MNYQVFIKTFVTVITCIAFGMLAMTAAIANCIKLAQFILH